MKFIGISFIAFLSENLLVGTSNGRDSVRIGITIGDPIILKKCGLEVGTQVKFEIIEATEFTRALFKSTIIYQVDERDDYSITLSYKGIESEVTEEKPTDLTSTYPVNIYAKDLPKRMQ